MLLLTINSDAWIALVYMRCVWYLLCPRTQRKHSAKKLLSNCIYAVAFACLGSSSNPKPTPGSIRQTGRDVFHAYMHQRTEKTIEAEVMFDRKFDLTAENEHVAEYHQK